MTLGVGLTCEACTDFGSKHGCAVELSLALGFKAYWVFVKEV